MGKLQDQTLPLPAQGRAPGRIIARLKAGADSSEVDSVISGRPGLRVHHSLDPLNILVLHFPEVPGAFEDHVNALGSSDLFDSIEPDYLMNQAAVIPNDTSLNSQWYLSKCKFYDAGALGAWDITTGAAGTLIASLDT